MKLLIPKIGTRIVLTQPWTFKLQDSYRNDTFWRLCHGEPKKKTFYYGYTASGYQTSPTPTTECPTKTSGAADPIDTTIPVGTVLFVESFHIQKGHTPQLSLRIKKDNKTRIPNGKFQASIDDINKMDVDATYMEKYPNGRFGLRISTGVDRSGNKCKCRNYPCSCGLPVFTDNCLTWESDPDAPWTTIKRADVVHTTDTAGLDKISNRGMSNRSSHEYSKYFDNLQECLNWAAKKGFRQSHVDEFIKKYDEKRIEWEKSKV